MRPDRYGHPSHVGITTGKASDAKTRALLKKQIDFSSFSSSSEYSRLPPSVSADGAYSAERYQNKDKDPPTQTDPCFVLSKKKFLS